MEVFVKLLDGKSISLIVDRSDTIRNVKAMIQDKRPSYPSDMRLLFAGMNLDDGLTVAGYDIRNYSTLHVAFRLLSCRQCPGCAS
ncbi:Chain B, Cin85 Sh3-C Domain In Complex With Ubiquitin [Artemisia annua]|uniref:Chain B, Cin85 Sh3-C Domain In Complex With Ubiquitin n=1 Tax=Artemisia annua TaxID=35608 RepID=A0A2U1KB33_ARTAN|nr:Chain B, Cin85 Sh3-C Domain In Complex With Ubiquitin [Artemisia annua]